MGACRARQDGRYARELARLLREAGQVVPPELETMTGGGARLPEHLNASTRPHCFAHHVSSHAQLMAANDLLK